MGCGGSQPVDRPGMGGLQIWGDYFSSETRVILSVLEITKTTFKFEHVDTFAKDANYQKYLQINPTGQIPTITEGKYIVLGGSGLNITYLLNAHKNVKEALYPDASKQEIDRHLSWFQGVLKVCSNRIFKMSIGPKVLGEKAPAPEELKAASDEFFKRILTRFD